MISALKNHPFAVEAFFESSVVVSFAVAKEQLQALIPPHLALDTFKDKWGFVAVAMVQTKGLRPKGFPSFMGNDFFLIGYRIFVRYTTLTGKRLRGLYIIKSETNKKKMEFFGNVFTHYNYTTTDITEVVVENKKILNSKKSGISLSIDISEKEPTIPHNSPFLCWQDARKFAGPLPFTFTYQEKNQTMLIIEGVRQHWKPEPIKVDDYQFDFLKSLQLDNVVLANAFEIKNVPYHWKKGWLEKWK
jgi:hypothetical protein